MDKKSTVIKIGFMVLMFVLISNVMVIKTKADEYLGFNYYDKGSSTSTDSAKKEGVALDESAANNYLNNLDNIGFSERPLGSFCIFSADKIFK
ncbi:MAG: hypothetical protein IJC76_08110 [Lachnospiraceae bacterium]|nr:hypothetical protein [Lachnospiraceae bacterium]